MKTTWRTTRLRARQEEGISSLEMLIVTMILLIFILALFWVAAAFWNNTLLQSTAQNASLTAQFEINNALSKDPSLANVKNACANGMGNSVIPTTATLPSTCVVGGQTIVNPWRSAQQVVANSTSNLMLVPKGAACSSWWLPPLDIVAPSTNNSSGEATFVFDTNSAAAIRTTTVTVNAPFRPMPIPNMNGTASACPGILDMGAKGITKTFIPPNSGFGGSD